MRLLMLDLARRGNEYMCRVWRYHKRANVTISKILEINGAHAHNLSTTLGRHMAGSGGGKSSANCFFFI